MRTLVEILGLLVATSAGLVLGLVLVTRRTLRALTRRLPARATLAPRPRPRARTPLLPMSLTGGGALAGRALLPGQAVARARQSLRRDVRGTRDVLRAAERDGRDVEALRVAWQHLHTDARGLDTDLRVVQAEPDGASRRRLLVALTTRVQDLHAALADVRRGLLLAGAPPRADTRAALRDQVQLLDLRATAHRELSERP